MTKIAQKRQLIIKAGMTPEDVIKSDKATTAQKKLAKFFDSDGIEGYSHLEARLFNETSISMEEDGSFILRTNDSDMHTYTEKKYSSDLKLLYERVEAKRLYSGETYTQKEGRYTENGDTISYKEFNPYPSNTRAVNWQLIKDLWKEITK